MAGTADRLRPHVKTHKLGEIVQLQLKAGITRFKCATIAEAEMLAQAGARDVLLANQLVGPNARRLAKLAGWFREVRFSTIADDAEAVGNLASAGQEACYSGRTDTLPKIHKTASNAAGNPITSKTPIVGLMI